MNIMFILTVCFGVVVLAIAIASNIFNANADQGNHAAPWMRRVRLFQNDKENTGWRIQMIPYDNPNQPKTVNFRGWAAIVPVTGALGFIVGACVATYDERKYSRLGLWIAVSSLLVAFGGVWLKARFEMTWDASPGRCVDRELRKILIPAASGSAGNVWVWFWRIVCDYEYMGIRCRVTPEVCGSGFNSEASAHEFLAQKISQDGTCTLRVDPKNPLRTRLFDHLTSGDSL